MVEEMGRDQLMLQLKVKVRTWLFIAGAVGSQSKLETDGRIAFTLGKGCSGYWVVRNEPWDPR